jgi:hypothetical protein
MQFGLNLTKKESKEKEEGKKDWPIDRKIE